MFELDPKLREFAYGRNRDLFDAIVRTGGLRAGAASINMDPTNASKAIRALKKRAALQGYSPDHDMHKTVPDGFTVKGVSTYYDKEGQARGQWVKSAADDLRRAEMLQAAADAMAAAVPRAAPLPRPADTAGPLANLYTFTDFHLGMMAWHKEGGADWDLEIAERTLLGAFEQMILGAPRARVAVVNIQGDFLHTDGLLPVTPAHKHVLDAAGRYPQMIDVAIRCVRRILDIALTRHAEVHVVWAEGNHDEQGSMVLRKMFAALYEREPRLTVNDSELPYYVYQHGETMLAFHHGHLAKNETLPLIFAAQFSKMWGATTKRYAHCGHRHHAEVKEHAGMTVMQHPTLAARDAYAARGGWIAERGAQCITYHDRYGQVGMTTVTPEMLEAA